MGAWGYKLFDDDLACDIKEEYINKLKIGKTNKVATAELISENSCVINDIDTCSVFWFALADTQWNHGRLLPEIQKKALEYINTGENLKIWEDDEKSYNSRKKVLVELEKRLKSVQPKEKKITKISMNRTPFKIGDILLYRINDKSDDPYLDELPKEYLGKYVLFQVLGIDKFQMGSLPIEDYYNEETVLGLLNWVGSKPIDINKVDELFLLADEYMKEDRLRFGLGLTQRRCKKMGIELLTNNLNYIKNKSDSDTLFIALLHDKNLDPFLLQYLGSAKNTKVLIEEI